METHFVLAINTNLACGFPTSSTLSLYEPDCGGLVALLPGIHHAPDHDVDTQPQITAIIRALESVLIDTYLLTSCHPALPFMSPSTEQYDLRDMLNKDFHAHVADAYRSDYDGPSTDYTYGHPSSEIESPVGSPAAYNTLVSPSHFIS
jgi:hypothetical protein